MSFMELPDLTDTEAKSIIAKSRQLGKSITIPMIRKVFPKLMAEEIVGVQPMTGSVSKLFTLSHMYDGGIDHPFVKVPIVPDHFFDMDL